MMLFETFGWGLAIGLIGCGVFFMSWPVVVAGCVLAFVMAIIS